jgi:methionine-rich copper-binding protein CopC
MRVHRSRWQTRSVSVILGAAVLSMFLASTTAAHSDLVSSDPADGGSVLSPFGGPIVLTFSEHLADGSKADLLDSGRQLLASATVAGTTMTITLTGDLGAGAYTVEWVSIADDGDLLRGTLGFTVAPRTGPSETPTSSATPTASATPSIATTSPSGAPPSAQSASPEVSPTPGGTTGGGTSTDVVLPIVIVLIVAAAGAFYLVRRNRPA